MSLAGARARLASVPTASTRRAYSILSKPGGGRFAIAAKVPKAIGTPGSNTTTSTPNPKSEGSDKASTKEILVSKAQAPSGDEQADKLTVIELKTKAALSTTMNPSSSSDKDASQTSITTATNDSSFSNSTRSSKSFAHALEPHPKPTNEAISLHSFFSLHRPLLLLPIHASQPIFTSPPIEGTILEGMKTTRDITGVEQNPNSERDLVTARREAVKEGARVPSFEVDLASGRPIPYVDGSSINQLAEEDIPEADADAARLLGRSYVLSRIGGVVDWQATLGRLGDSAAKEEMAGIKAAGVQCGPEAEAEAKRVRMDSVKRKRRKKMNKHIYKKRRKRERAQRRRLGK